MIIYSHFVIFSPIILVYLKYYLLMSSLLPLKYFDQFFKLLLYGFSKPIMFSICSCKHNLSVWLMIRDKNIIFFFFSHRSKILIEHWNKIPLRIVCNSTVYTIVKNNTRYFNKRTKMIYFNYYNTG